MPEPDRRQFLKRAVAFTAGAVLPTRSAFTLGKAGNVLLKRKQAATLCPRSTLPAARPCRPSSIARKGSTSAIPPALCSRTDDILSASKGPRHGSLVLKRSDDGELTWSEPESIFRSSQIHLCEAGLVRSPGGDTLDMLLHENRRRPSEIDRSKGIPQVEERNSV